MGSYPDAEGGRDSKVRRSRETGERKAREMDIIVEIGRLISSTLEIEEVYERFAVEVRKLIPFDRININLKDPDGVSMPRRGRSEGEGAVSPCFRGVLKRFPSRPVWRAGVGKKSAPSDFAPSSASSAK